MHQTADIEGLNRAQLLQCTSMNLASSPNKQSILYAHKTMKKNYPKSFTSELKERKSAHCSSFDAYEMDKYMKPRWSGVKKMKNERYQNIYQSNQKEEKIDEIKQRGVGLTLIEGKDCSENKDPAIYINQGSRDKFLEDKYRRFRKILKNRYFVYVPSQLSNKQSQNMMQKQRIQEIYNKNEQKNMQIKAQSEPPKKKFEGCRNQSPKVMLKKRPSSGIPITRQLKRSRQESFHWSVVKPNKQTLDTKAIQALQHDDVFLCPVKGRRQSRTNTRVKTEQQCYGSGRSKIEINGWEHQNRDTNATQLTVKLQ